MPSQRKPPRGATGSTRSKRSRNGSARDALQLLRTDHRKVQELFDRYRKARGEDKKAQLAREICAELKVHTQIEEEVFYPAAREVLSDEGLIDEATVEHAAAKDLIEQIEREASGDGLFDAKVTVLGEYVKHHIKEEQNELFPKLKRSRLDLGALGETLAERKEALQQGA